MGNRITGGEGKLTVDSGGLKRRAEETKITHPFEAQVKRR